MMARAFTNPNFGNEARVELNGKEVRLIFVAGTYLQANELAEDLLRQLKSGALNITVMGKPTKVTET